MVRVVKPKDAATLQLNYEDLILNKFEDNEGKLADDIKPPSSPKSNNSSGKNSLRIPPSPPSSNRFTSIIENIERMYTGAKKGFHEGYDLEDPFIDDEDEIKLDDDDEEEETFYGGFFINKGKTIQIKQGKKRGHDGSFTA